MVLGSTTVYANGYHKHRMCKEVPTYQELKDALDASMATEIDDKGGASTGSITSGTGFGHTDCGLGENAVSTGLPTVP